MAGLRLAAVRPLAARHPRALPGVRAALRLLGVSRRARGGARRPARLRAVLGGGHRQWDRGNTHLASS